MKILIVGDSFKNITGLNEVSFNIMKYFYNKGYEVGYCIIKGSNCKPNDLKNIDNHFYEYFNSTPLFNCQKDQSQFDTAIKIFKPDIVFSIHDLWNLDKLLLSQYRSTYKWIAYCPIESKYYSDYIVLPDKNSFRKSLNEIVENIDLCIPYTDMGKKVLNKLGAKNITENVFNGIEDFYFENVTREKVFKGTVKENDFVFMTVGTNFQRKGLAYVIEAFSIFIKSLNSIEEEEKYKLYIHGKIDTVDCGTDIKSMVIDLGLIDNIIYSSDKQISKRELHKRYKCCDCYIGLPLAEGFGIPFAEAMINKLPIIYHDYGGHIEYIKNGYPVESISNYYPNNQYSLWKIPSVQDAADMMTTVVYNIEYEKPHIEKDIEDSYQYAKENLTWNNIYKKLDEVLKPFIETYKPSIDTKITLKRIM